MEICHYLTFGYKANVDHILDKTGLKIKRTPLLGEGHISTFTISEEHPNWPEIAGLIEIHRPVNLEYTHFDEDELREAEWCQFSLNTAKGYPQPEVDDAFPSIYATCSCGTYMQIEPYAIKGERVLTKRVDFTSLHWIFEFFARNEVFDQLQKHNIYGHVKLPIKIYKTEQYAENYAQLYVPQVSPPILTEKELTRVFTHCPKCGVAKLWPHTRGRMQLTKSAIAPIEGDIFQTYEWFGGGANAFRVTLISKRLTNLILDQKWKGVVLNATELC